LERKILSECREADENNAKLKKLKDGLSALKSDLSNDLKDIELLREKRKVAVEKAAKLKEELKAAEDGIEKLKSEKGKKSSRLVSLKELQDGYESCNEGTRSVMKAAGKAALPKDRIHGLAADCIVVPKEYEAAVEAVLGEKLQYIVVQNREDGAAAIDYLKSLPSGRTSFVPLDADGAGRSVKLPDRSEDAVRLADFVLPADEKFRSIVSYLIEDAVLVPTLDDGIRIGKSGDFSGTFVTRQGDIINSCGVLTGGKETNGGGSMLRNRREIAELEREIERLSSSLEGELQAKNKTVSLISSADTEAADSGSKIHELELSINGIRKDIERSESEIKWIEQRINVLVFNKENLESEKIKAAEKIKEIEKDAASHESRAAAIDRDISSLQEKWRGAKSDLEEKEKSLVKEKILLTSIREKRNSGDETLKRLAAAISDIENRIRQNADDAVSCEAKIAKITENIEEEKATLTNLYEEHKKTETELSEKRTLQTEKEVTLKSKEAEIQKAKKNFEAVSKELNECEMEIREISIRMEAIKNSAKEKFSLDPEAALPEFAGISESEAEELGRELEQNKKKLENFAEVNLLALNEYEQLKERYDFLAGQIADLNSSLDTLKGTITRINHISKKKFFETFEAVNNCFKDIFPKLFPGGKGKLVLTDESNILETGIDIDIQISGKKRQNLSLLSGGEKALSAVALIFSILTHRPTPFLIFDEVDAPLDDVNVSLFRKLMKEIALNSQIILITHNKKTMEIADDLIGATMEKNGISTIVSVSMN
jgi:chromosome segregation protein